MPRDISKAIDLLRRFEGIEDGDKSTVNYDPYLCPADYWTIGWGHVVLDPKGKMIKGKQNKNIAKAIYPNGITLKEAEVLLNDDVKRYAYGVEELVKVPLSDTRFCVLISFAYNVGISALKNSTLLKLLNQGQYDAVPKELKRWNKITKDGEKVVSQGLVNRREAEATVWDSVSS